MVVESGVIPYDYDLVLPFRAEPNEMHPLSGIILESAQFVQVAEHRQFMQQHFLPEFNIYTTTNVTPSGPYDPKNDGSTVANMLFPGCEQIVNPIIELRNSMNFLFHNYSVDSDDYSINDFRGAWFQQAYPESASGFLEPTPEYFHRDVTENEVNGAGAILSQSDEILGASGQYLDIDWGEVIYQPIPYFAKTKRAHSRANFEGIAEIEEFFVVAAPFYPSFQTTDGDVVKHSNKEPEFLESYDVVDGFTTSTVYRDPVRTGGALSGAIKVDGVAILSGTKYQLARIEDGGIDFQDQPFVNSGVLEGRVTGDTQKVKQIFGIPVEQSGVKSLSTRAFMTPAPLPCGVYSIRAYNDADNIPVQSGIVSEWPHPSKRFPQLVENVGHVCASGGGSPNGAGYEVFDDAIWMTDYSVGEFNLFQGTLTSTSGLAVVSPFTGKFLWNRIADGQLASAHSSFVLQFFRRWHGHRGLVRVDSGTNGTPSIFRLARYTPITGSPDSAQVLFQEYDDLLNYKKEHAITVPTDGQVSELVDLDLTYDYNNNDFYVDASIEFPALFTRSSAIYRFAFTGTTITFDKYWFYNNNGGVPLLDIVDPTQIAYINGSLLGFRSLSGATSGIAPITLDEVSPSPATANYAGGTSFTGEKPIHHLPFDPHGLGNYEFAQFYDLFEVKSADSIHVPDGTYALISGSGPKPGDPGLAQSRRLFLLQIEEETNSYSVKACYDLGPMNYFVLDPARFQAIHMKVRSDL
jgi:hypothetical protein